MAKRRTAKRRVRSGKNPDRTAPQIIDGASGKPIDTPQPGGDDEKHRRIDLSSLRDVRLEMAAVYRKVNAGDLGSQDGSRRVFMLRQIADVLVNAELERRVGELEERAAMRGRE